MVLLVMFIALIIKSLSFVIGLVVQAHRNAFHTRPALLELYGYAKKYMDPLMVALNADEFSERAKLQLPTKLWQVYNLMNGDAR